MTLKELKHLSKGGPKKRVRWFNEHYQVNMLKQQIAAELPEEQRKQLAAEEWERTPMRKGMHFDKLYNRIRDEYGIDRF